MHIIFNQDIIHCGLSFLVLTFYHSSPLLPFDKYQTVLVNLLKYKILSFRDNWALWISATHPGWSSWSAYTPCDENCYKSRERYCYNNGNPQSCQGSPNIYGIEKQTTKCSDRECYGMDVQNL